MNFRLVSQYITLSDYFNSDAKFGIKLRASSTTQKSKLIPHMYLGLYRSLIESHTHGFWLKPQL